MHKRTNPAHLLFIVILATLGLLVPSGLSAATATDWSLTPAKATNVTPIRSVSVQDDTGESVLDLEFDSSVPMGELEDELAEVTQWSSETVSSGHLTLTQEAVVGVQTEPMLTPETTPDDPEYVNDDATTDEPVAEPAAAQAQALLRPEPNPKNIYCQEGYSFLDSRGRFWIQRGCNHSRAPWAYQLSATWRRTVVGTVQQRGMWYTINGGSLRKDYAHSVPPDYKLHGFYRVKKGDVVSYADRLTWRHRIGPGGRATLNYSGLLKFRGRR